MWKAFWAYCGYTRNEYLLVMIYKGLKLLNTLNISMIGSCVNTFKNIWPWKLHESLM